MASRQKTDSTFLHMQDEEFVKVCSEGNPDLKKVKELLVSAEPQSIYNGLVKAFDKKQTEVVKVIVEAFKKKEKVGGRRIFLLLLKDNRRDIAEHILDNCFDVENNDGSRMEFNFSFLVEIPVRVNRKTRSQISSGYSNLEPSDYSTPDEVSDSSTSDKVITVFDEMKKTDPTQLLLLHPVVKSLLSSQWSRYLLFFYFINLSIYLVYLGNSNNTIRATRSNCGISSNRHIFIIVVGSLTATLVFLRLLFEFLQLINQGYLKECFTHQKISLNKLINWKYFKLYSNYIEVPMYILSVVFLTVLHRDCLCPSHGQWQAGTVCLFLSWIALLVFLNKWPSLGIYIGMLWQIVLRFLMVAFIIVLLLIAFTFAFYMAFYEPSLPDTPFENPIITFMTMMSFAIGSPDISIFRLSNDETKVHHVPYPAVSYGIWITFGILISVLFLNFLVGLAVDDVQALRKEGQKRRIKLLIGLLREVEETMTILIAVCKTLRCTCCEKLLLKRLPMSQKVDSNSFFVKSNIFGGDEVRNTIAEAHRIKSKRGGDTWKIE